MLVADAVFGDAVLGDYREMPAAGAVFGAAVLGDYPEMPLLVVEMLAADAVLP